MDLSRSPRRWSAASPSSGRTPRRRQSSWRRISSRWWVMVNVSFAKFMKPARTRLQDTNHAWPRGCRSRVPRRLWCGKECRDGKREASVSQNFVRDPELLAEPGFPVRRSRAVTELRTKNKGDVTMKFMMIVKLNEKSGRPPQALMDAIDKLGKEAGNTMIGGGGLGPTAAGARVRLSGGEGTGIDGPFTQAQEIIGGHRPV